VIDECVAHGQRGCPQKVRFIREAIRRAQAQIGLVDQGGGLERVIAPESGASALRDVFQLVIKGRQQLCGDAPDFRGRRAVHERLIGWGIGGAHEKDSSLVVVAGMGFLSGFREYSFFRKNDRMSLSHHGSAELASRAAPATTALGLLGRVKGVLFAPKSEWLSIARECATPARVYTAYVMPLAGFAALIVFLRFSLAGRAPLASAATLSAVTFGSQLLGVYAVSLIVNALASSFGGVRSQSQALKVAAYACTPVWIAAPFTSFPALSTPAQVVAGIYYTYLLYLGSSVLMKSPRDRALGYATTVVLSSIIFGIVLTLVGGALAEALHVSHYRALG
jgi:hypothetical protein